LTTDLNADFAAGFGNEEPAVIEPVATPEPEVIETPNEAEAAQAAAPQVETVSLTKEQWESAQAQLQELNRFRETAAKQVDGLSGKLGELNRNLQNVPKPKALNPESFARLKSEYPDLGALLEQSFADAPAAPQKVQGVDPAEVARVAQETAAQQFARLQLELRHEAMEDRHEDWREVVTSPDFEAWRKTLPAEEGERIAATNSPRVLAKAIDQFKASKTAPAVVPAPKKQSARLEAAITPQGKPGRVAPSKSEVDYFKEGFGS
jgi:chromosome segregation ATPase